MAFSDDPRRAPGGPSFTFDDNGVTFLMVCGGGRAPWTDDRIRTEQALGHQVHVIATPNAATWLDNDEIEALTGWPLRSAMPGPLVPIFEPLACRVLASPVTLNTLTKWADGHSDNLVISLLCEATGMGIPVRAEVSLSAGYAAHPAVAPALARLTAMGVTLSAVPGGATLPIPSTGSLQLGAPVFRAEL
jgi:phosphopantothenoylcysteine synthetase/decarboxylase